MVLLFSWMDETLCCSFREEILTEASVDAEAEANRTDSMSREEAVIGNVTRTHTLGHVTQHPESTWLMLKSRDLKRTSLPPCGSKCFQDN